MEQRIQLSDHFGFGRLIRFTIPSILMMIFTSIYGVVDGYFVSNFVGKTPFAAVNFIMPFLMVVGAMGFMFGTGGSALIARIMGEGSCDLCFWSGNCGYQYSVFTADRCLSWREGRDAGGLHPVWTDHSGGASVFNVAVCVWQPFRDGGEAEAGADCNDHFGCAQYDGRCSVHGSVPLGNCRSGYGDCDGTDHRRNDTAGLFPAEEQQQPAPSQTKVGWRSAQTCLHQRCIGIDEQYFHVHCRHAV